MCSPWWTQTPGGWKPNPCPHAAARNTILGLEKQVLWRHGTLERTDSDSGTHLPNDLTDTWAKELGLEWVYHIPYHAPASRKTKWHNGLRKTTLRATGSGTFKHWDTPLAKATWLVNIRGSTNPAGPAQSQTVTYCRREYSPCSAHEEYVGKTVRVTPVCKGKPIHGITSAQGPGCTCWVIHKDGEVRHVPHGDLILGENSQ